MSQTKTREEVTYLSTKKSFIIRLRPIRRLFVNKQMVREPGLRATWINGRLVTSNPEVIGSLDALLTGPSGMKWRRRFQRAPSQTIVRKMAEAANVGKQKETEVLDKTLNTSEKQEMSSFHDFIKKQKQTKKPTVSMTGTRSEGSVPNEQPGETFI